MKLIKFNEAIKEWRIFQGLTQSQWADELGVSEATIKNWEQGNARPTEGRIFNPFFEWFQQRLFDLCYKEMKYSHALKGGVSNEELWD